MSSPFITSINTALVEDDAQSRNNAALAGAVQSLAAVPILHGAQLTNVQLTTTPVLVAHALGRVPRGYIVTKRSALQHVATAAGANVQTNRYLLLVSGGNVTVDLWVY